VNSAIDSTSSSLSLPSANNGKSRHFDFAGGIGHGATRIFLFEVIGFIFAFDIHIPTVISDTVNKLSVIIMKDWLSRQQKGDPSTSAE
jgi:hypothetical protein